MSITRASFERQMARLGGLKYVPADLATHWEALQDMPETALIAAVTRAQRTRNDFPTPLELRQDADQSAPIQSGSEANRGVDLAEPVTITVPRVDRALTVTRTWSYYCDVCQDSGWRGLWCGPESDPCRQSWIETRPCGRLDDHAPHGWGETCCCADWNPEIKRRKAALGKYAQPAGKGRG